jgi:transposase
METLDQYEQTLMNHIFVGVDLHKNHHTAVILTGFKKKLGEIKFDNTPNSFPKFLESVNKYASGVKKPIFGLEDTGGFGRALAVFLVAQHQVVKEVNPAAPSALRKSMAITEKSDSKDAEFVGRVLVDDLEKLPDANPNDHYWVMGQLVTIRKSLSNQLNMVVQQFHGQIAYHYPSYRKFFSEVDGKTALLFYEKYPSPHHLAGTTIEELREFLRVPSNHACSLKHAQKIVEFTERDGETKREYQEERDFMIKGLIRRIRSYKDEMAKIDEKLERLIQKTGLKLDTMYGIDTVTAAYFLAEIGCIDRFANANKLARFAGIAPVINGSGDNHSYKKCKKGNRELHELFYALACRQIGTKRGSKAPNHPYFYAYYQKKLEEKKTKHHALVCIMRKLVPILYSLMKNKSEYVKPAV